MQDGNAPNMNKMFANIDDCPTRSDYMAQTLPPAEQRREELISQAGKLVEDLYGFHMARSFYKNVACEYDDAELIDAISALQNAQSQASVEDG